MDKSSRSPAHLVVVSSPGMGHLNPFMGLANRLSSLHSFKVTVLHISTGHAAAEEHCSDFNVVTIPAADISNKVDPRAKLVTRICVLMRETAPSIRAAILGLRPRPTVLVLDTFGTEYLTIARDLALPCFVFVTSAWFLALTVYCPVLDKQVRGEYVEQTQGLVVPGCVPVRPEDLVEPMLERSDQQYAEYLRIGAEILLFDGVILATWRDLEGPTLTALGSVLPIPFYDIGPIDVSGALGGFGGGEETEMLMEWLDRQADLSVIYISFGSGGTLSAAQMNELALGLELSQQRFLWVVRPPKDEEASGSYLGGDGQGTDDTWYLPREFKERTRGVGWLVPRWASQSKVLSHPSVGGFLTHCGWNSITESLTNGVPMMAWPLFAEQRMNATFVVEEIKVAIRASELPTEKVVGREEIRRKVKELLKGEEGLRVRLRAQELQTSASQALTPNTGSSYNSLSEFVQKLS